MAVVAGLPPVNAVAAFAEETPQPLKYRIKPDILVNGGEFQVEPLVGIVSATEGNLINPAEGKSSAKLLNIIRGK